MNDKKKQKKSSPIGVLVAGAAVVLINVLDEVDSGSAAVLLILLMVIAVIAIAVTVAKKVAKNRADGASPVVTREVKAAPRSYAPAARTVSAVPVKAQPVTTARRNMTAQQRRMEQLNSFLKSGIIDRAEYNALMRRWCGK